MPALKLVISNMKGGVSKTMTAIFLGNAFAEQHGLRTLIVDLDEQSPHPEKQKIVPTRELIPIAEALKLGRLDQVILPSKHYDNLFVTVGDQTIREDALADVKEDRDKLLARALDPLEKYFDVILIDTKQTFDLVTLNGIMAADLMVVPCDVDRDTLQSTIKTIQATQTWLHARPQIDPHNFFRILISNFDAQRDQMVNDWFYQQLAPYAQYLFKTRIHRTTHLKKARTMCLPLSKYIQEYDVGAPAAQRAVEDFNQLANEVLTLYEQTQNQEIIQPAGHTVGV